MVCTNNPACSWARNAVPACIIMEYNNVFMTQATLWSHRKPHCITGSAAPWHLGKCKGLWKAGTKKKNKPRDASKSLWDVKLLAKEQGLLYHSTWQCYWRKTINLKVEILGENQFSMIKETSLYLNWDAIYIVKTIESLLKTPKANQQVKSSQTKGRNKLIGIFAKGKKIDKDFL